MAFHPYPQVIAAVFNRRAFGPPRGLTPASACPGIAHPASRPRRGTRRPVRTRFRCGSLLSLTSPRTGGSLAHSTKGTPSQHKAAPTARGRTVSGAVSLPSRGAFHLSLTVLVRYRSQGSVQGWMVVHPASDRVPRARPYSGTVTGLRSRLRVRGCNPLRPALPCRSARLAGRPRGPAGPRCTAPQPRWREGCRPYALTGLPSAPFRSPLLGGSRD